MPRFITGSTRQRGDTICDRHRVIWQTLRDRDPNDPLLKDVRRAYWMAKRMHAKLVEYKEERLDAEKPSSLWDQE